MRELAWDCLHRASEAKRLLPREFAAITNYVKWLEDQNSGLQRGLKQMQTGGAKWWLEHRLSPESRRSRVEGAFASTLRDLHEIALEFRRTNPVGDIWLCHNEIELPLGSSRIAELIERESRVSGN